MQFPSSLPSTTFPSFPLNSNPTTCAAAWLCKVTTQCIIELCDCSRCVPSQVFALHVKNKRWCCSMHRLIEQCTSSGDSMLRKLHRLMDVGRLEVAHPWNALALTQPPEWPTYTSSDNASLRLVPGSPMSLKESVDWLKSELWGELWKIWLNK